MASVETNNELYVAADTAARAGDWEALWALRDRLRASGLDRGDALRHVLLILKRGRQDVAIRNEHGELTLDVHRLIVLLEHDLVARVELAPVEDLVLLEQGNHVLGDQVRPHYDGNRGGRSGRSETDDQAASSRRWTARTAR